MASPPGKTQIEPTAKDTPASAVHRQPVLAEEELGQSRPRPSQQISALLEPGAGAAGRARTARALQRSVGNARLGRMLEGSTPRIQRKLSVSAPGDAEELEADSMARRVVGRDTAPGGEGPSGEDDVSEVSPETEAQIDAERGRGQPLPDAMGREMEGAFEADFGGVRVHADAPADRLSRSMAARAFSTGQDVFFRQGEYQPGTGGGQELLAHELTHTIQQGGAKGRAQQRSAGNAAVVAAHGRTRQASEDHQRTDAVHALREGSSDGRLTDYAPLARSFILTGNPVVQRGKGKAAGKIAGWIVTVGERKLIKRAAIYTEKEMAKLLGKGYNILVRGGRKDAERAARKIWGDDYVRHAGHFIKKAGKFGEAHFQPVKQLAKQHARKQVEKGWHIFYSAAGVLFLSEEAEATAIYEDKYPGQSIANYLTVTKYAGEDSWLSYIDWVNPLELVAIGGDIGRNWDRERTKELKGLVFSQAGRDGSVQTYEMDPDGILVRVIVASPSGVVREWTAEDFYIFLATHTKSKAPLPEADASKNPNYAGDFDAEYRIYLSKKHWHWDHKTLSFFLPADEATKLVKVGAFWINYDASMKYLYVLVHPQHRSALREPGFLVPGSMVEQYLNHAQKESFLQELLDAKLNMVELSNLRLPIASGP
jgi:Domain of unknown function (DUF4157)